MALFIFREPRLPLKSMLTTGASLGGLKATLNWGWGGGREDKVHFPPVQ